MPRPPRCLFVLSHAADLVSVLIQILGIGADVSAAVLHPAEAGHPDLRSAARGAPLAGSRNGRGLRLLRLRTLRGLGSLCWLYFRCCRFFKGSCGRLSLCHHWRWFGCFSWKRGICFFCWSVFLLGGRERNRSGVFLLGGGRGTCYLIGGGYFYVRGVPWAHSAPQGRTRGDCQGGGQQFFCHDSSSF